jgi:ribonuclease HI
MLWAIRISGTGVRRLPRNESTLLTARTHSVEERLRRVERREAAHIVHLLTTTHAGIYGDEGLSDLWRDEFKQDLTKQYNDLRLYDDEVKDPRIKVHLEDINPPDNETSISGTIKWQRIQARRVHTRLKHDASALDATTDGSFRTTGYGPTTAGIDVTIQSIHPISEHCEMGTIVRTTNEAELSALLRGLQVVRDIFQDRGESREFRQYKRIIFATNSIMSLQSLIGSGAAYRQNQSELQRTTRLAALCRMQAYGILEAQKDIESIHFIWLPKLS